jgi:predicted glycosyltransferase involved in capsule biosynthesis
MDILAAFDRTKPLYSEVFSRCYVVTANHKAVDISVVVPVCGRLRYHEPLYKSILEARIFAARELCSRVRISITFVEHDTRPRHKMLVRGYNYIYIPREKDQPFNKSLCHNIGALFGPPSRLILFHDIDTLVRPGFFVKLLENMKRQNAGAVQCFTQQRLLLCDEKLTEEVLRGRKSVAELSATDEGVTPACSGALGGSICVEREVFFKAGGFDTFFSGYSVEDAQFYHKAKLFTKFGFCNNPAIELFHLHHENRHRITPSEAFDYHYAFLQMSEHNQKEFCRAQENHLRKYQR